MRNLILDWRTAAHHWGSSLTLLQLFAGEGEIPALQRFALRWLCQACERYYLGTDPAPQYCPACHRQLTFVAQWDLCREYAPRWWPLDPGERPW